ncbi:MAG: type II toxin-antitoxin system RelE/ParE family toxin [Ignavibacteria bacterium]|nr:type II toxin-antitoxin system RelE/ParE family toxin [Ignavibacteria bacterium]
MKTFNNLYRIRIGDYRAVFEYTSNEIIVLKIGHRKEIYK